MSFCQTIKEIISMFSVRWDGTPQIQEQCIDLTFQARTKKKLTRRNPDETKKSSKIFFFAAASDFVILYPVKRNLSDHFFIEFKFSNF
ncbi:hypothetical protein BpHYR1_013706 [Brachionus plicatilis]|uniref:Uncharacterized protein n=1 Tax=Brachionus plicatilis TaxID=10195 RepID=A0A3M7QBU4_BRAPC|nr:hypothetical protein BpHYR1_013706 [Brachionus plicatilis]